MYNIYGIYVNYRAAGQGGGKSRMLSPINETQRREERNERRREEKREEMAEEEEEEEGEEEEREEDL